MQYGGKYVLYAKCYFVLPALLFEKEKKNSLQLYQWCQCTSNIRGADMPCKLRYLRAQLWIFWMRD